MMTPEEIRKRAEGWDESQSVIGAFRADSPTGANCELCEHALHALQETIERAKRPGWHLVCRECWGIVSRGRMARFGGRYSNSKEAKETLGE